MSTHDRYTDKAVNKTTYLIPFKVMTFLPRNIAVSRYWNSLTDIVNHILRL